MSCFRSHRPPRLRRHRRRAQVDRARGRRRTRLDRRRDRHRDHLRQGDRVGRPPARDEGRAAVDPLARLRADRGGRLLHLHLRPDRLLPLGRWRLFADIATLLAAGGRGGEGGSFLVSPSLGLMFWTLLAFGVTMFVLSKAAFPRIGEALEKRANAIRENIEASEQPARGGRRAARGVPPAAARGARAGRGHRRPRPQGVRGGGRRGDRRRARPSARSWSPRRARTSRPRPGARSSRSATRSPT